MSDSITTTLAIQSEEWINRKWRPMMAVTYMAICIFDFILGPLVNFWFFKDTGATFMSWKPLTMSDGGMFHLAMGAIIGITAWQRGQEKMTMMQTAPEPRQPTEGVPPAAPPVRPYRPAPPVTPAPPR